MKLAEALQARADLNRRIAQLRSRLESNALVQEGESPAEDPAALLAELDDCITQLESLIARINRTNCRTTVGTETLTDLLARRDALTLRLTAYRAFAEEASTVIPRATRSEIKILSTVSVRDLQKQVDAMSKSLRELDNLLQQTNWTVDLLDE